MFKLTREETPEDLALADRHQWPVRVTAANTSDDSPAFVFVMRQASPGEWSSATFSCVASAQQMDDLPTAVPGPDSPFYRVATVTALCRSADAALEFGVKVEYALRDLANNLAAAEVLAVAAETIITPDV
jgi:hypothetical protein